MARRSLPTCLAAIICSLAMMPATSHAAHRHSFAGLAPVAEQLHCSTEQFERLACERSIGHHDRHRLRQLSKSVCRLQEGISTTGSLGRVKADLHMVKLQMRLVGRRVRASCALREDPVLASLWERVRCDYDLVQQTWAQICEAGQPALPSIPAGLDGRHHGHNHAVPPLHSNDLRRRRGYDGGRFAAPYGPGRGQRDYGNFGRPPARQASSAPLWLDALMAALAR